MIIWVYGTSQHITWVFLPSSSADLAVGLSNRWFFKPGLKTFNSPFLLTQRRWLTLINIMNGYLQHDWWVWVPYIVSLGVRLFESYGKKSWILVRFLVDPIVCMYVCMYVCTRYVCMYVHTLYMYVCMYVHVHTCIHVWLTEYVCTYECMNVCSM